jgi:uncharacterized protein YjbI with pentapeptide repeats
MSECRSREETWVFLEQRGLHPPRLTNGQPVCGNRPLRETVESAFSGLRLDGKAFEDTDLDHASLERSALVRCRFHGVSFAGTDLKLSLIQDCTFVDCDFQGADLLTVEVVSSTFFGCRFAGARLVGADLTGASLEHCDFGDADLTGTRLLAGWKEALPLTERQRLYLVNWQRTAQEEEDPPGSDA